MGGRALSTGGLTTSHKNIFQIYRAILKKSNPKEEKEGRLAIAGRRFWMGEG
jgi:hypothetical protein